MDYTFLEIQKASMNLAQLDNQLKQFLSEKGNEFKALKKEVEMLREENTKLKSENDRLKNNSTETA